MGINAISSIAFALLIGAVVLGLGGTILDKIRTTQSDNTAIIDNNESFTWTGNNSINALVQATIIPASGVAYCNTTKLGLDVNFSMTNGGILILNQTAGGGGDFADCRFNVTYTFTFGSAARNTSTFGLAGVDTFAGFIPTVAVVAAAGVVIGILLLFFGRKKIL